MFLPAVLVPESGLMVDEVTARLKGQPRSGILPWSDLFTPVLS
jgi:hypothetical protein